MSAITPTHEKVMFDEPAQSRVGEYSVMSGSGRWASLNLKNYNTTNASGGEQLYVMTPVGDGTFTTTIIQLTGLAFNIGRYPTNAFQTLSISYDGTTIGFCNKANSPNNEMIILDEVSEGNWVQSIIPTQVYAYSNIQFNKDGTSLIKYDYSSQGVNKFTRADKQSEWVLEGYESDGVYFPYFITASPNLSHFWVGSTRAEMYEWDGATYKRKIYKGDTVSSSGVDRLYVSKDGKLLVHRYNNGITIRTEDNDWNKTYESPYINNMTNNQSHSSSIAISDDNKYIVTQESRNGQWFFIFHDNGNGFEYLGEFPYDSGIVVTGSMMYYGDGKFIASSDGNGASSYYTVITIDGVTDPDIDYDPVPEPPVVGSMKFEDCNEGGIFNNGLAYNNGRNTYGYAWTTPFTEGRTLYEVLIVGGNAQYVGVGNGPDVYGDGTGDDYYEEYILALFSANGNLYSNSAYSDGELDVYGESLPSNTLVAFLHDSTENTIEVFINGQSMGVLLLIEGLDPRVFVSSGHNGYATPATLVVNGSANESYDYGELTPEPDPDPDPDRDSDLIAIGYKKLGATVRIERIGV